MTTHHQSFRPPYEYSNGTFCTNCDDETFCSKHDGEGQHQQGGEPSTASNSTRKRLPRYAPASPNSNQPMNNTPPPRAEHYLLNLPPGHRARIATLAARQGWPSLAARFRAFVAKELGEPILTEDKPNPETRKK